VALILDTGPIYAALDRRDAAHSRCRELVEHAGELLVIPAPVLVELDWLIQARLHPGIFTQLLDDVLAGAYVVEDLDALDFVRVRELCDQYADSDIGFVDAAVLAVVERRQEPKLATLDRRHFGLMRPRHRESLRLLPD